MSKIGRTTTKPVSDEWTKRKWMRCPYCSKMIDTTKYAKHELRCPEHPRTKLPFKGT